MPGFTAMHESTVMGSCPARRGDRLATRLGSVSLVRGGPGVCLAGEPFHVRVEVTVAATLTQAANHGLHGCPGGRGTRPGVEIQVGMHEPVLHQHARLLECAEDTIEEDELVTSGRDSCLETFEVLEAAV